MEVLNSIKVADVPQLVKSLSPEEQDVLMKYLYAGMAAPEQNNSGHLLAWHEKVRSTLMGFDVFDISGLRSNAVLRIKDVNDEHFYFFDGYF